ncbi:beta-lactamase-like protein [Pasteurella bettyae]|nr:beta-lactamase-like protein [Pasteurella bettyae]
MILFLLLLSNKNCSLIWDDDKNAAIIDPGGEAQKLIKKIEDDGLKLQKILLTHGHLDHVGAALSLKKHFNVDIIGPHEDDVFWFESLLTQSEQFGLFGSESFLPDRWLNQEHEIIEVGSLQLEVIHLPGHTPGHIGFLEHSNTVAFTGDVLFRNSIGRTDFPGGSHEDLMSSIKEKLLPLGDDWIIIAGHGPYTTIGAERKSNPFLK